MAMHSGSPRTLAQIAVLAGVSVPTVSKVINQRTDVAPATRERVQRVLAEHGYVLGRAGRPLGDRLDGRGAQIDFVVHSLHSTYAAEILRGVEDAVLGTDARVVLASTDGNRQRERHWVRRLAVGAPAGAILVLADQTSEHLRELRRHQIPFVVVDRLGELGPEDLSVSATNWAGGRAATAYLLTLGHRRIAALLGPPGFPCTGDRLAGYRAALDAADLPVDPALIRYGDWQFTAAYAEMRALLALPDPPTAVFVGSDEQCLGVYRALHEHGLVIPESMSVVGFDDMPYAELLTPALTTVRQPLREMGRVATTMLLRVLAGEPVETLRVELATPLIKRASCGPPGPGRPTAEAPT
ncbi:MAG TPA: LacI family DNA-binding transcriptional regulator [Chloroflexota bacterium]